MSAQTDNCNKEEEAAKDATVGPGPSKKCGAQATLGQMSDLFAQLVHEVEEVQWENLHLKCQLARLSGPDITAFQAPVPNEPPANAADATAAASPPSESGVTDATTSGSPTQKRGLVLKRSVRTVSVKAGIMAPVKADDLQPKFTMLSPWAAHSDFLNIKLEPTGSVSAHSLQLMSTNSKIRFQSTAVDDGIVRHLIIHPFSKVRCVWLVASITLLLYDLFYVPLDVCFRLRKSQVTKTLDIISMSIWTLDIPLTFLTGFATITHLEMRFRRIAKKYIRTWLCFDIFLVVPDYITLLAEDFPGSHVALLRMARWSRFMRLLRIARITKLSQLMPLIKRLATHYHLSRTFVQSTKGILGTLILLLVSLHIVSCLWFGFGIAFDDGWIQANNLEPAAKGELYIISLHWSCSRLLGSISYNVMETPQEILLDALLICFSLLTLAAVTGQITILVMVRATSKPFNLWKASVAYSQRHELSAGLDLRLTKALAAMEYQSMSEIVAEESKFLGELPAKLRGDLMYESHLPFLVHKQFFKDMVSVNERVVRHLCFRVMSPVAVVVTEAVFDKGDAGTFMRFVTHGSFAYRPFDLSEEVTVRAGTVFSEATLWTKWEHYGELVATEESMILTLDATLFGDVVMTYISAYMHAVKYAKHFVWRLNQESPCIDDLTAFEDLDITALNDDAFDDSPDRHFVFISHYKLEAGTEATLIFDQLSQLLKQDASHDSYHLSHPIFVDSENLRDLGQLKSHVKKSDILVILLTPGLLTRPWCLIEIATAIRFHVSIVLVEIQRPGQSKFEYPDEEFYTKLRARQLLDAEAVGVVESEGVTLEDVENAIRRAFCKIALPFSPHKSKDVRLAELNDILRRCNLELAENPKSWQRTGSGASLS